MDYSEFSANAEAMMQTAAEDSWEARAACHAAYYGLFHAVWRHLEHRMIRSEESIHRQLRDALVMGKWHRREDNIVKKIWRLRCRADYRPDAFLGSIEQVDGQVMDAVRLAEKLDNEAPGSR